MDYSKLTTYLSDITLIQAISILCVSIICCTAIWTMLTYISIKLANSAKDTNKKLLDNMNRLDAKSNINQKLTNNK
jgi:hypothetical protein